MYTLHPGVFISLSDIIKNIILADVFTGWVACGLWQVRPKNRLRSNGLGQAKNMNRLGPAELT